ncbi:MAG: nucleotide sugar dehydrogenase [Candidatus Theseobacter exili]|nr:nucleotide sugar dehydrogenase [Candidatus Theseobacter exili]
MKIMVMGTGFVGLTHAAVCSEYGHIVYAYDIDSSKINGFSTGNPDKIEKYVNEPGLSDIVRDSNNRSLYFTTDFKTACDGVDAVFLCLPTPPNLDGSTDLSFYDKAVNDLAKELNHRKNKKRIVVINKSTVPIGTARHLLRIFKKHNVDNIGVASNPEFLAEGNAVDQSRHPDRVVVGCDTEEDFKILRRIYSQFVDHVRIKYIESTPETAEAIKYMANTLLLNYISFWNGVGARIGEVFDNVLIGDLRIGVTSDNRISTWGSYVSNGAGGSCFGKDVRSLRYQMSQRGVDTTFLKAAYDVNEYQKKYLVDRAINELDFMFNNKRIAVLGLAFKKRTNDMRDASSIELIETLLGKGVEEIRAFDPLANEEAAKCFNPHKNHLFSRINYFTSIEEAVSGTDALFISSDCEEFRGISGVINRIVKPPYLIIDGRRMIPDCDTLVEKGFSYVAVGSKSLKGKNK